MSKVKVSFSVSIDGFGAAPQQSLENPMGVGGEALGEWVFATRTFQRMHDKDWTFQGIHGKDGGTTGIDDDFFARSFLNVGAYIFGRNMFGPVRGPWPDNSWKGPWGDTPPFRNPVFVLTHYPRESIPMQGGTTFHFVTEGIHPALERATAAANGKDICIGGVATVQQYLRAGLIDELNLANGHNVGSRPRLTQNEHRIPEWSYHYSSTASVAGDFSFNAIWSFRTLTR